MDSKFEIAADLILDAVEDAFGVKPINGRESSKRAVMTVLNYFFEPKSSGVSRASSEGRSTHEQPAAEMPSELSQ